MLNCLCFRVYIRSLSRRKLSEKLHGERSFLLCSVYKALATRMFALADNEPENLNNHHLIETQCNHLHRQLFCTKFKIEN